MIFRPAYAEIILPLAVRSNFTYAVRAEQAETIAPGMRVLVSFGKSKIYTGIVRRVMDQAPEGMVADRIKPIEELLDESPVLHPAQLELYDWLSFYYFCTPGEIIKAALPAGLKPESALRVEMCDVPNWHEFSLSDKEFQLMEALMLQPVLTLKDIAGIWDIAGVTPRLRSMASRGLIRLYQQVEEKYKPRFKSYLRLSPEWTDREKLELLFEALSRAPKQENLLMRVVSEYYRGKTVPKSETLKELDIQSSVAKSLIDKGILQEEQVRIDRIEMYGYETVNKAINLTERQQQALAQIRGHFALESPKPVLLEGVTGSGKTHLYIELIRDALAKGKQALYLLPEITLTKQIIDRVQGELGEAIGIYHSKFSNDERVEIWQKVSSGEYRVVIGVRSAIFLPFPELGLIVVDEEHDSSFKQHEPAPRYHARDVAVFAGTQQHIPILLGSATPAFESYYNARAHKYHHVLLPERAVAGQMPQIEVVDMRKEKKKGQVNGIFSLTLENAIVETLGRGEQVILFQNRRGYAPYLICESCGHVPECINCDISLTYHKEKANCRCHYCGYVEPEPVKCPQCGHFTMVRAGIGTEKIEEEVKLRFPDYRVERMDLDTTRTKWGYKQIIERFERGQIDILVGTQMVSKGLDFENVTFVGVIQADPLLTYPDFRAFERAYQLLVQVSGRAGRAQKQGKVLIQTLMPDNLVLHSLQSEFKDFFIQETPARQSIGYPPFTRLIRIEVRHRDKEHIEKEARALERYLRPHFGPNLLGPDFAVTARLRNQYRMQFLLKLAKGNNIGQMRQIIQQCYDTYYTQAADKTLVIVTDVDPI